MAKFISWRKFHRFILVVSLVVFLSGIFCADTFAQEIRWNFSDLIAQTNSGDNQSSSGNPFTEVLRRVTLLISPSSRIPITPAGRARGGAGRGQLCPSAPFSVAAFVPTLRTGLIPAAALQERLAALTAPEIVFGKTISATPTFWFYVPYEAIGVKTASFMLLDTEKHQVLREPILIEFAETPGIIEFQLPYSLEVDRLYNWYFSILCDAVKPSRNPGVRGWIQRVSPPAGLQSVGTNADHPYEAYIEQGIWFEAVTDLAKRYRSDRANLKYQQDWAGLLEFIERPELKEAAMVECCKPNS